MSNLQKEKMKKKLYNTPQMNIVKINISNLLNNISADIRTDVNDVNVWGDEDEE